MDVFTSVASHLDKRPRFSSVSHKDWAGISAKGIHHRDLSNDLSTLARMVLPYISYLVHLCGLRKKNTQRMMIQSNDILVKDVSKFR